MKTEKLRNIIVVAVIACIVAGIAYLLNITMQPGENEEKNTKISSQAISEDKHEIHNFIIIEENGRYGFADLDGKVALDPMYDVASIADYGLYYVKSGKNSGFLNSSLDTVFMSEETIATNISENFVVYNRNKKSGFINIKTGEVIDAEFDAVYDFSEGLAGVVKDGALGFINTSGKTVIDFEYTPKGLNYFKSGSCYVRRKNSSSGYYINQKGEKIIDRIFEYGMPFYEERSFVKDGADWYVIDAEGNLVLNDPIGSYHETVPGRFLNGYATVIVKDKYGVIDSEGKFTIYPDFEELLTLNAGKIVFKKSSKYGLMRADGVTVIEPKYDSLDTFKNSLSVYGIKDKKGVVTDTGKELTPPEYKGIDILDNGLIKILKDDKSFFYINPDGETVWQGK